MDMRDSVMVIFLSLPLIGCSDSDADKLRKVGDKTYDRASTLVQHTWDELSHTLLEQQPQQHDLATRVKLRLQWDRDLAEVPITIAHQGDVITLTGTVKTEVQKERAAILANQTLGVGKVNDDLKVEEKHEKPGEELPDSRPRAEPGNK
jgi:hypothetical protein